MGIEATTMTSVVNQQFSPLKVNVTKANWQITSIWDDALVEKVICFITQTPFEFYATGTSPSEEKARKLVNGARERAEIGIPFTRLPVLNPEGSVIGEFAIGFDKNPRKIQLAMRIQDLTNAGISEEVLGWGLSQYLPSLYEEGFRFPVFAQNEDTTSWGEKTVTEWLDLHEVTIVATAHPENKEHNDLFLKMGFTKVEEKTMEAFQGVHDGRRNVYELAVATLLKNECTLCDCSRRKEDSSETKLPPESEIPIQESSAENASTDAPISEIKSTSETSLESIEKENDAKEGTAEKKALEETPSIHSEVQTENKE